MLKDYNKDSDKDSASTVDLILICHLIKMREHLYQNLPLKM